VDPDKAMVWRGPMVAQAFEQLMRDVLWPDLEVMVIDLPPGTGDVQLTMSQKVDVTAAVIVTTPQEVALIDARKAVNMFQMVKVPIAGIVENMSYYLCRQCGAKDYIFGRDGARSAAERMNVPFLGEIPLNTRIRTAGDEGTPPVLVDEEQERIFAAVVDQIEANLVTA
jgi:ATP-binding protein involved in chromosome partitioning